MRKVYKFAAAFLTLVLILPFGNIPVFAYDDCDVNHDGYVDISDAVAVNKYLAGVYYISAYNRFDTNKSLTVDYSDADKILAQIVSHSYSAQFWDKMNNCAVSFPTVSGFTPDPYASSTDSRTYRRYSYVTHQELSSYSLTPTAASFNSNSVPSEPREIIGDDDRLPSLGAENTGIVRLQNIGTGFIVGDHVIATAAHNVYNRVHSGGSFKPNTPVIHPYNANGTVDSSTTFTPIETHVPYNFGYSLTEVEHHALDYALITVSDDLSDYMHFTFGTTYNVSSANYSNIPLYVLGPVISSDEFSINGVDDLYYGQGSIVNESIAASNEILYYDCDTLHGDSGAPVYTITKVTSGEQTYYYYTVVAIHGYCHKPQDETVPSSEGPNLWNGGSRITKYQLQFFDEDSNPNISY